MKTYKVQASYVVYLEAEMELEDDEDPWYHAKRMDGGDFSRLDDYNWSVDSVELIEETPDDE